jgi:signal transduction histidine kinase
VAADGRGVGLLGIQERIAGCGGHYELRAALGEGTCLTVTLPACAPADGAISEDVGGSPMSGGVADAVHAVEKA